MSDQIVSFPDREQLISEAAIWVAKLDAGHLTTADLSSLREWAGSSKQHRDTLEHVASEWDDLAILALGRALIPVEKQDVLDSTDHSRWRGFANAAAVAGVTVLLGALGWFLQSTTTDATYVAANGQYVTAIGEQRIISLPDGSEVHVNTNSHLEVTYGDAGRFLRLLQGEAFFDVAPNAEKPFVVRAGQSEVVAIGTAFAVRLERRQSVRVTVSEGRVTVGRTVSGQRPVATSSAAAAQVNTGQTIVFDGATIDPVQTLDPPQLSGRLAWRDGMLRFTDESLSTVVAEVTRYTPRKIVISDPSLRDLAFSGYFRTGDTAALLSTLAADFNITITEVDGDIIYLRPNTP